MNRARYALFLIALLAWLVQGAGAAHAASYGDAPHDHDGVACALAGQADRDDDALPPPVVLIPAAPMALPVVKAMSARLAVRPATTVTPPGRAPPLPRA